MREKLDPKDFMITRKRKKYKFAKFYNAENCFEIDEWQKDGIKHVDVVEVGAGDGKFSLELAAKYPDKTFVALDIKADRLQSGAYEAIGRDIKNVFFVRARADQLVEIFEPNSLEEIWLTFSDPFPKKGSAGRRLTHPTFLARYKSLLLSDGSLCVKHDNTEFFQWTLEQLVAKKWHINELSFDLLDSELSEDYKILTTYEKRWLDEGRITQFVRAKL